MTRLIAAAILLLPLLEIAGFVVIGGRVGLGLTLLWVLAAALIGLALIRQGGLNAVAKLQSAVARGQEPGHSLIDGAAIVIAGLLLIVPGFVSDLLAVILLLPATRNFLLRRAAQHFETRVYRREGGTVRRATVIEGDFEVVEPDYAAPPGPTGPRRPPPRIIDQSDDDAFDSDTGDSDTGDSDTGDDSTGNAKP